MMKFYTLALRQSEEGLALEMPLLWQISFVNLID